MKKTILNACIAKNMKHKEGARLLSMHPKSFSRLKRQYLEYGMSALIGKKPGPKAGCAWNRTPETTEDAVVLLADQHRSLGPQPLTDLLGEQHHVVLNSTTVWRILKRRGERYFHDYEAITKKQAKLYSLDVPGDELQLDACYPYGRQRKLVSFDAIDDCSRFVLGRCFDRETERNAETFLDELVRKTPFSIQRIRVDNRYAKKFKTYAKTRHNIEVINNEAYHPQQNGKIERFHKTLKYQFFWKYTTIHDDFNQIQYRYQQWINFYNFKRKHRGFRMDGLTPAQKLASTLFLSLNLAKPQKVTGTMQQYIT